MKRTLSKVSLENCQIKSDEKFKAVAHALDVIEIETFIGSGLISFAGMFICPDIDLMKFFKSGTPTERLVAGICIGLHVKRYGKNSRPDYLAVEKADREQRKKAKARAKGGNKAQGGKADRKAGNKRK